MFFLVKTIEILITIYIWMIIIRALLSCVSPYARFPLASYLIRFTDPFLRRIRRLFPLPGMAFDISPVIAILILMLGRYLLLNLLTAIAY